MMDPEPLFMIFGLLSAASAAGAGLYLIFGRGKHLPGH
jgi:hypothetical protein